MIEHDEFTNAISTLRQVKEKFCPREMLQLIELTFKYVERAAEQSTNAYRATTKSELSLDNTTDDSISNPSVSSPSTSSNFSTEADGNAPPQTPPPTVLLNADNMMPLTVFLLLRAAIPHLGTEILLLEELMGSDFELVMHGYAGYCFTTIKAAYQHIINESFLQQ